MMGENNISKKGNVSSQVKGLLKSSWQSRYLVLYSGSSDSHPHIEVFDSEDKFTETKSAGKKCEKKIDLNRVKYINKSTQKSSSGTHFIIEIQCKKEKHVFSLNDEYDWNDWDYRLNKVVNVVSDKGEGISSHTDPDTEEVVTTNLMYEHTTEAARFEVTVKEERLSLLSEIAGRHVLCISDRELAFEEIGTRRIKCSFHFAMLRKFGKQAGVFFFECGRKCPNGEGIVHCLTDEANQIHDAITYKSKEALKNSRPPDPTRSMSLPVQNQAPTPVHLVQGSKTLPADINNGIGAPSLATNVLRKHPGNIKQPELIPIRPATISDSPSPPTPKRTMSDHKSVAGGSKRESVKKHGPATPDFTKELEHVIHRPTEETVRHSKIEDKSHRDLRMTKEKKKSDKEDKKGKEDRKSEKEGKKSKEDRKSEKEGKKGSDEKKSKGFFSSKKKDKDEKHKPVPPVNTTNLYEEPDQYLDKSNNTGNANNSNEGAIYDEAISGKSTETFVEPVEYAQPYAKKSTKQKGSADAVMYSDIKGVPERAWMTQGEEEEIHEEDYFNIKDARQMKERQNEPPPLPQKLYDLSDDTYNTLDLGPKAKQPSSGTQNIYGTAGATPVGKLTGVQVPEKSSYMSESEGSSGDLYDGSTDGEEEANNYDGYEETTITKQSLRPKPKLEPMPKSISSTMYEEIPSPPVTSPTKLKQTNFKQSYQESLYDEVS